MIKSPLLSSVPGVFHGFGTINDSFPRLPGTKENHYPIWQQVHGTDIIEVLNRTQSCGQVDALFTRKLHIPLGLYTADCVPILMVKKTGEAVAAIHAGWRGTKSHILRLFWKKLESLGEKSSNWLAAIGPAIGSCCYEVSRELAMDFRTEFSHIEPSSFIKSGRHLDLQALNAAELKQIGIGKVEIIRQCTFCTKNGSNPAFHSYRREKSGTRQYSVIVCTQTA